MAHDPTTPIYLNPSIDPDPVYMLEVLDAFAECVRIANHQTLHREALTEPSEVKDAIRYLETAASRIPQLCGQLAARLSDMYADGGLRMTGGEFLQPVLATLAVEARLEKAGEHAEALRAALASAANVVAQMAQDGGIPDER